MISKEPKKSFGIMGANVKQSAEQFEQSQSMIEWADREGNIKFFNGGIQAFYKEAVPLLQEIGVIRKAPPETSTMIDTQFLAK